MSAQHEASPAWCDGYNYGADDYSIHLDWKDAVKHGEPAARRRQPGPTPNPHEPGSLDHADWDNGYQHGWHDEQNRESARQHAARSKGYR